MIDPAPFYMIVIVAALMVGAYRMVHGRAARMVAEFRTETTLPDAQPRHHARLAAALVGLAGVAIYLIGLAARGGDPTLAEDAVWLAAIVLGPAAVTGLCLANVRPDFAARARVEYMAETGLMALALVALLTTVGIVGSLVFEASLFFRNVSVLDFLFGTHWSPQTPIRAGQAGQSGAFGAVPVFAGTFLVTLIAMVVAAPVGLMVAIYLSEYASSRTRAVAKPAIEVLAGIPSVVYGFFALISVGPLIRDAADWLGFGVSAQSALAVGLVMGVMIIPLVSSLSDDVIRAVPQSLRNSSTALGATRSETLKRVVFRSALPGIIGAFLLAISRAIGETMIVVMAASRAATLTGNPFDAVTTVTVQIVALLTGDQVFDSPRTLAAFALGLVLFVITLLLNIGALAVVNRYRVRFE
ncbi:phosphate ABC transporter permease subunit PstC [uncultured Algimonas sp.]|uniref:phosphate ABC transporter permease subunit PstC n=1 Tax=uncultured Algimonas sp. TaxID=1547920 RepID=UPI0026274BDE|nr:phosphate ABC transporter permease subunit PstC [uncultured Algimonas sp.]